MNLDVEVLKQKCSNLNVEQTEFKVINRNTTYVTFEHIYSILWVNPMLSYLTFMSI